jgi:hypothetical protein
LYPPNPNNKHVQVLARYGHFGKDAEAREVELLGLGYIDYNIDAHVLF